MKQIRSIILCLMALTLPDFAKADFNYNMQPEMVAENVYAIITPTRGLPNPSNGGWNSNSAFIITEDGVVLFDTGSSEEIGRALKGVIATVTDQPVRWIINSHAHGDHWLGNAAFADTVEHIYAGSEVMASIRTGGQTWVKSFNVMTDGATGDSRIVPPDTAIDARSELRLGGIVLVLLPSGGSHSPGDLMLWLPTQKVLIGGDVIYSDRMPSTNAGSLRQWIETLATLQSMNPEIVVPGHGAVTDVSGIERLHALLTSLWTAVAQGIEEGQTDFEMLPDVIGKLAIFNPDYPGMEDKLRRDLPHVYLQVEAASFE